jgi:hypothetical protein
LQFLNFKRVEICAIANTCLAIALILLLILQYTPPGVVFSPHCASTAGFFYAESKEGKVGGLIQIVAKLTVHGLVVRAGMKLNTVYRIHQNIRFQGA